MRKGNNLLRILIEITLDILNAASYFFKSNLRAFANVLTVALPYLMYFVGQFAWTGVFDFIVGWEILIPVCTMIAVYYLHSAANKTGKGNACPVPAKRFTEVSDDGEVSVEQDRIQELLLYVADLEDWMERKNIL